MIVYKTFCPYYFVALICLMVPFYAVAQSGDSFSVSQQIVTADTIAPTVPSSVLATPVAATQIDITWGVSTDDKNLSGYRLFRDAVHIATTTLTSYSNTGLTPSTTYTYTVEAFDWFFNTSTTSLPSATTTLALPVVVTATTTDTTNTSSQFLPRLVSLQIEPSHKSAQFQWETNIHTRYVLRWGRTEGYDLGFIQNDVYRRTHTTTVEGLEAGTEYTYELIGINKLDREFRLKRGVFTTQINKDVIAPPNVSDVKVFTENNSVYLQWVNPVDADFAKVRIVRNHLFYPIDPADGFIVYEGPDQSFFDEEVFNEYPKQYYTIFAYDATGNVSSGAVVFANSSTADAAVDNIVDTVKDNTQPSGESSISFADVLFVQEDLFLEQINEQVFIDSKVPIGVQIPYGLIPGGLKIIVMSLTDRYGDTQSYILRSNSDKTMYQALLRNLPKGTYDVLFSIYDYRQSIYTTFKGQVISHSSMSSIDVITDVQEVVEGFAYSLLTKSVATGFLLAPLIFSLFLFFMRRSREDNYGV
jgi:hypothetical protein